MLSSYFLDARLWEMFKDSPKISDFPNMAQKPNSWSWSLPLELPASQLWMKDDHTRKINYITKYPLVMTNIAIENGYL